MMLVTVIIITTVTIAHPTLLSGLFYPATVRLRRLIIVNAHQEQMTSILLQLGGIVFSLDLVDGRVGVPVELQLQHQRRGVHVFAGYQHYIGEALARG